MDAVVTLDHGMRFTGSADTGHPIVMDASPVVGGEDSGPRPMELILAALCGCTAMDVISILRKKRQEVSGLQVKAHAEQNNGHPRVFTEIHLEYIITGKNVDPKAVERSIKLSADIYCPAQAMLSKVAEMTSSFSIVEE
ncbi:MAG: OsmC family protein [Candidatus Promineifilaceae bacterium]|nr:OsmC family protein [Candidatus Promineifilaceae bacterium]